MNTVLNLGVLKTLGGALNYSTRRYNRFEMAGRDWEVFCSHLNIHPDTIHSVALTGSGFKLETKNMKFEYVHSDFHEKRNVIIVQA